MKDFWYILLLVLMALVAIAGLIAFAFDSSTCSDKGGVMVKTVYGSYVCTKALK